MDGGTFTISNGGVFGSLMGTPIINPPQSAILGIHAINDRPVAINGKVLTWELHSFFLIFNVASEALSKVGDIVAGMFENFDIFQGLLCYCYF